MPKIHDLKNTEKRREQILNAAKYCFARHGFHQTSMRQIIDAAGLSAGGVYHYFPAKETIVQAIAEAELYQLDELFSYYEKNADARDAVFGIVDSILKSTSLTEAVLATELFAESCRNKTIKKLTQDNCEALERVLVRRIELCKNLNLPVEVLAKAIVVLCEGLIGRVALGEMSVRQARQAAKQVLKTWL